MRPTSGFNHSASLNAHHHRYTKSLFRKTTSISFSVALTALLIWAFAPLTSDANYKAVSSTSASLNQAKIEAKTRAVVVLEQPLVKAARSFKALEAIGPQLTSPATEIKLAKIQPQLTEPSKSAEPPAKVVTETPIPLIIEPEIAPVGSVKSFIVKRGDTLSKLFQEAGIPLVLAIELNRTAAAKKIRSLKPGRELKLYFDADGQWETLEYALDKLTTLVIALDSDEFQVSEHEKEVSYETVATSGVINSSLGSAAAEAGLSYSMVSKLVDIFKWEIDFARDIQAGDQFKLIYQKAYLENEFIDDGEIMAAEFWNRGKPIQAVRFQNNEGKVAYYKPDGESLKRGFLRTPVKLAKITSGFSKRRLHPIKRTWTAHKGVDYGARSGTPILATGDGVVQYAGKKGGYGNTVVLRHGGETTTLYAHMRKFGKGIRTGKRVTQGQTIGYVGQTGWATGPHLHYEFRINGRHKNPLKVEFPRTDPVASSDMTKFKLSSAAHLNALTKSVQIKTAAR